MRLSGLAKIALVVMGVFMFLSGCMVQGPQVVFEETSIRDETFVLKAGYIFYSGGDVDTPSKTKKFHWVIESSVPVDVFVVPSHSDYQLITLGEPSVHYPSLRHCFTRQGFRKRNGEIPGYSYGFRREKLRCDSPGVQKCHKPGLGNGYRRCFQKPHSA